MSSDKLSYFLSHYQYSSSYEIHLANQFFQNFIYILQNKTSKILKKIKEMRLVAKIYLLFLMNWLKKISMISNQFTINMQAFYINIIQIY